MKFTAIYIDDEPLALENLSIILEKEIENVSLLGTATNIIDGAKLIKRIKPDIVFLDVAMPTGSGFDLLDIVDHVSFEVVFITAYEQYATNAIKRSAFDYLYKPIDPEELKETLSRLSKKYEETSVKKDRIYIGTTYAVEVVRIDEISYLQAQGSYTIIHLTNKKKITAARNLKYFEQQLLKQHFLRVHRSYVINLEKVIRIVKEDGGTLMIEGEIAIPISGKYTEQVRKRFSN